MQLLCARFLLSACTPLPFSPCRVILTKYIVPVLTIQPISNSATHKCLCVPLYSLSCHMSHCLSCIVCVNTISCCRVRHSFFGFLTYSSDSHSYLIPDPRILSSVPSLFPSSPPLLFSSPTLPLLNCIRITLHSFGSAWPRSTNHNAANQISPRFSDRMLTHFA